MKNILTLLFEYGKLSQEEARTTLLRLAAGEFNEAQIAAFLSVYQMRSISVEELTGFRDALLELCLPVDFSDFDTIDLCGTGGDGKNTFNISTLSSFLVAGTGTKVTKHGNYGVSSSCGSSNVMEYLGYQFTNDTDVLRTQLEKANICVLHAPLFHPAMKAVAPVRKQLGVKTFFNMLGPMVNPSQPQHQLVGVFNLELARLYHYLFQRSDKKFVILHSLDGYDEISLTGPFKMISVAGERVVEPREIGFEPLQAQEIYGGGSVKEAAAIFTAILEGRGTAAQNSAVIVNSAFALHAISGDPIEVCLDRTRVSLDSGRALKSFKTLIQLNP